MLKPVEKPIKFVKNLSTEGKSYPVTHVSAVVDENDIPLKQTINNILLDIDNIELDISSINTIKDNINNLEEILLTLDSNLANTAFIGERPNISFSIDSTNLINCTLQGNERVLLNKDWQGIIIPNEYMDYPETIDVVGSYTNYTYDNTTGHIIIKEIDSDISISAEASLYIPYVKEGLVFWLDGINKGPNDDAWTDLIGEVVFPNHGYNNDSEYSAYKAVSNTDNWETSNFNQNYTNTGSWLGVRGNSNDLVFDRSTSTIEGVYKGISGGGDDGGFSVCHLARQTSSSFTGIHMCVNKGGYINGVYIGNTLNVWSNMANGKNLSDVNKPHTISMNNTRAINNGITLSSLGVNHWSGNGGGRFINCSATYNSTNGKPQYFSKGNIYSIRIYNRILTEEEMLHNLRVDNERFNLGITTIPEEQ